jgi:tRNA G18 (ribose-2'-O)-methylase SpoU
MTFLGTMDVVKDFDRLNIATDIKLEISSNNGESKYLQLLNVTKEKRLPVSMMTVSVKQDRNVAAMARTAEIMGLSNYFTIGHNRVDLRSSQGAHHYLNFERMKCDFDSNENEASISFNVCMKRHDMIPIFVEQGGEMLSDIRWDDFKGMHLCFIFGSESSGIPEILLNQQKRYPNARRISIEQFGVGRSLNVSVACGIVLYDYIKWLKRI